MNKTIHEKIAELLEEEYTQTGVRVLEISVSWDTPRHEVSRSERKVLTIDISSAQYTRLS